MTFVVEGLVRFPRRSAEEFERFITEFEEVELPVIRSSSLGLAGAWSVTDVGGPQLLHLYGPLDGLADLTASARSIAQLPSDHPYLGLYTWVTGADIRYSRTVRPLVPPVDRAWWEDKSSVPARGSYFVATCRYGITGERTVRRTLPEAVQALDASPEISIAIAYDTLFGDYGSTRLIGTAPTLEAFSAALDEHTSSAASERDPWTVLAATPLPYSPLA